MEKHPIDTTTMTPKKQRTFTQYPNASRRGRPPARSFASGSATTHRASPSQPFRLCGDVHKGWHEMVIHNNNFLSPEETKSRARPARRNQKPTSLTPSVCRDLLYIFWRKRPRPQKWKVTRNKRKIKSYFQIWGIVENNLFHNGKKKQSNKTLNRNNGTRHKIESYGLDHSLVKYRWWSMCGKAGQPFPNFKFKLSKKKHSSTCGLVIITHGQFTTRRWADFLPLFLVLSFWLGHETLCVVPLIMNRSGHTVLILLFPFFTICPFPFCVDQTNRKETFPRPRSWWICNTYPTLHGVLSIGSHQKEIHFGGVRPRDGVLFMASWNQKMKSILHLFSSIAPNLRYGPAKCGGVVTAKTFGVTRVFEVCNIQFQVYMLGLELELDRMYT